MRSAIRTLLFATALAMAALSLPAAEAAPPPPKADGAVVVIVKVPSPWYAPDALIERKMRAALPQYQRIPGLAYKIFSIARSGGEFGGIYLWQDRASAEAWFNPAWFRRVKTERGVEADVRMFDAPRVMDNLATGAEPAAAASSFDDAVVTVVTVPHPANWSPEQILRGFDTEMAIERRVPGLLRRYALLTGDGRFGGAYLWRDEAAARQWLNAAWQRKVRTLYGSAPQVEWFDAPILMPSTLQANRDAERMLIGAAPR